MLHSGALGAISSERRTPAGANGRCAPPTAHLMALINLPLPPSCQPCGILTLGKALRRRSGRAWGELARARAARAASSGFISSDGTQGRNWLAPSLGVTDGRAAVRLPGGAPRLGRL